MNMMNFGMVNMNDGSYLCGSWADEKENTVSLALIRTLCINLQQLSFYE